MVKAVKDAHASAVTTATFLESSAQLALSGDARGRLVSHNVTAYLSITSIFAGVCAQRGTISLCIFCVSVGFRLVNVTQIVDDPHPWVGFLSVGYRRDVHSYQASLQRRHQVSTNTPNTTHKTQSTKTHT